MFDTTNEGLSPSLEALRQEEAIVEAFRLAWQRGEPPALAAYLPEKGGPPELVLALAAVDLGQRRRRGGTACVEVYLRRWPQLAADAEVLFELVRSEWELRDDGDSESLQREFAERFPELAGRLDRLPPRPEIAGGGKSKVRTTPEAPRTAGRDTVPRVPGFEFGEKLGEGGMGVVYRARQAGLNRDVALKVLLGPAHPGDETHQRFLAEAEAVAAIRHPGIVQVHASGTQDGRPYLAMEFCDGGSLADRLRDRPLAPAEAARLVEQAARAMQAAHAAGVVHRDLKPANVLLTRGEAAGGPSPEPLAKVADFGLARRVEADVRLTQTGAVMGTPSYMPPEQARGTKDLGPAVDVYALGAILYECLTGKPPFQAATAFDVLTLVVGADPVPPRQLNATIPKDLETICLTCLRKEPERRYASAAALAADLRRYVAGEPIAARPVGLAERAVKWARRRPVVAALLAVLAVGGAGGVAAVKAEQVQTAKALETAEANLGLAQEARREAEENFDEARKAVDECFGVAKDDPLLQAENLRKVRHLLLGKTLPFYERFAAKKPEDESLLFRQVEYLYRVAIITSEIGRKADALNGYERARDIQASLVEAHPEVTRYTATLARTITNVGRLQSETGKFPEALRSYGESKEIQTKLVQDHPMVSLYQEDLANTYNNLGLLQKDMGKVREALQSYEQAKRLRQHLIQRHPKEAEHKAGLATSLANLGNLQRQTGNYPEALKTYDQVRLIFLKLCDAAAGDSHYQANLAATYLHLGALHIRTGNPSEAAASNEQARDILRRLCLAHPEVVRYQADLASAQMNLGVQLRDLGRSQEAFQCYQQACEIYQRLAAAHPEVTRYQSELAGASGGLGFLQDNMGKLEDALINFRQSRDILKRLVEAHPEVPQYLFDLTVSSADLGILYGRLGRFEEALACFRQSASLVGDGNHARQDVARLIRQTERRAALDRKHLVGPRGTVRPDSDAERVEVATIAQLPGRGRFVTASTLFAEAFGGSPRLADGYRIAAAYAAAQAGCGHGNEAEQLDATARAQLRYAALGYLQVELAALTPRAMHSNNRISGEARQILGRWRVEYELAGVRDAAQLDKLPEAERVAWQGLWAEVEALLARKRNPSR